MNGDEFQATQSVEELQGATRLVKDTEALSSRAEMFLVKVGTILEYRRKNTIYSQGEANRGIYYIREGVVMFTVQSKRRRPAVVAVLGAGNFFNENCLLDDSRCLSTAKAITSSSILLIAKDEMASLLLRENEVSTFFVSSLLCSMLRFREDLADALVNSTEQRLARALLRLAHQGKAS